MTKAAVTRPPQLWAYVHPPPNAKYLPFGGGCYRILKEKNAVGQQQVVALTPNPAANGQRRGRLTRGTTKGNTSNPWSMAQWGGLTPNLLGLGEGVLLFEMGGAGGGDQSDDNN